MIPLPRFCTSLFLPCSPACASVHIIGVYLVGVHVISVRLIGVHLTGVHLTGVHLSSQACTSQACTSQACISALYFIPVSSEVDGPWLGLDMDNGELVLLCRRNIDFL